jgi:ubiquinone/menaquinone biosynthesis C-methylase UbiE
MSKPEPKHPEAYTSTFNTFYSYFAEIYDFLVKRTSLWEAWEGPIIPLIRGPRVLEVSFGPGWLITRYADRFETYGIDFNMKMIQITTRNLRAAGISVPIQRANVEALPYRRGAFDTVVNTMAFSGYPRADKAMSEFHRVLKSGGRLLLMDMGLPEDRNWIGRALVRLYEATGDIARDMASIFSRHGFSFSHKTAGGYGSIHLYVAQKD